MVIKPGECGYVTLEKPRIWVKDKALTYLNPTSVTLRTKGFLSERFGFTAIDLTSELSIVDQREPVRPNTVSATADPRWLKVDEGFHFLIPSDWKNMDARGIDSHVGRYEGPRAYLVFDELFGLGYTVERSREAVTDLLKKEADGRLLKAGEEVWRVDGRIAHFTFSKVDASTYGNREHQNVATLFVPYDGQAGYLSVQLFYADEDYLPTVRLILRSLTWPKKGPNKAPEPTPGAVTPRAAEGVSK